MSTSLSESARAVTAPANVEAARDGGISIRGLAHVYGDGTGLHPLSLDIYSGEFVSVLGPSGCGKSTLLRALAGLSTPQGGSVRFGDTVIFDADAGVNVPARRRGIGMVFQDLALWPHLSVFENVAFPLRVAHAPRATIPGEVERVLEMVGLGAFAQKQPHQLSGGQQQRVAIARALVSAPQVLLMDEPLSALDAALRAQLRIELRALTTELGLTTVYVTHDQDEAMAMSDRVLVLSEGRLRQFGTPEEVYEAPADAFVASFVGTFNRLEGEWSKHGIRPERVRVGEPAGDDIALDATVDSAAYVGSGYVLRCRIDGYAAPWEVVDSVRRRPGDRVRLLAGPKDFILVAPEAADAAGH